jgi:hypothetical protein
MTNETCRPTNLLENSKEMKHTDPDRSVGKFKTNKTYRPADFGKTYRPTDLF